MGAQRNPKPFTVCKGSVVAKRTKSFLQSVFVAFLLLRQNTGQSPLREEEGCSLPSAGVRLPEAPSAAHIRSALQSESRERLMLMLTQLMAFSILLLRPGPSPKECATS